MKTLTALLTGSALALGARVAGAQALTTTIGPTLAPIGTPISITACNDTAGFGHAFGCGWAVYDADWNLVYDPDLETSCSLTSLLIGPWGWHNMRWDQTDQAGNQVQPGLYRIFNQPADAPATVTEITIDEVPTSLWLEGTAIVHPTNSGQRRNFTLSSPQDPGRVFVQSIGDPQGPTLRTCAGPLPIGSQGMAFPDTDISSLTTAPILCGATGVLDGRGFSDQPTLCPPDTTALIGRTFSTAFLVLDPTQSCGVVRVSKSVEFELGG